MDENKYNELKFLVKDVDVKIVCGMDGLVEIAENENSDILLTSVVGNVGLVPTVAAIKKGKKILLANKETLVTAGELIIPLAKEYNVDILPVDSEHSAIFQCLQGNSYKSIKKILLTASGGPFFNKKREELVSMTKKDALAHPNWNMGNKITIDSATLMNKGLEVIEAKWLFDVDIDNIKVIVHRQSIVHSAVQFCDNSVVAQLGVPDMKLPISYAINYPDRVMPVTEELDLFKYNNLTFEKPDMETFKCLKLAFKASEIGGLAPTVMNAANEVAVDLFLNDKIGFCDIPEIVENTMNGLSYDASLSIDSIVEFDKKAREYAVSLV
jgi:1-deoxy-D-xylulose-5-phosphate reductoisomerase